MKKLEYLCETQFVKAGYLLAIIPTILLALPFIFTKKVIFVVFPVLAVLIAFPMIKAVFGREIRNKKMLKKILKEGKRYEGKVIGYKEKSLLYALSGTAVPELKGMDANIWTLVIEYNNITFETPFIVNNPNKIFSNTKCTVYEKDGHRVAYDFNTTDKDYIKLTKIQEKEQNDNE